MKCLNPSCPLKAKSRGLCNTDYAAAQLLVKNKKTTWRRLEQEKRALPHKYKSGNRRVGWLLGEKVK